MPLPIRLSHEPSINIAINDLLNHFSNVIEKSHLQVEGGKLICAHCRNRLFLSWSNASVVRHIIVPSVYLDFHSFVSKTLWSKTSLLFFILLRYFNPVQQVAVNIKLAEDQFIFPGFNNTVRMRV